MNKQGKKGEGYQTAVDYFTKQIAKHTEIILNNLRGAISSNPMIAPEVLVTNAIISDTGLLKHLTELAFLAGGLRFIQANVGEKFVLPESLSPK